MTHHRISKGFFARTTSSFVAIFLLFQLSLAGFASAATNPQNQELGFGAICQTQNVSADDLQNEHNGVGRHHNGVCCVLHFDTIGTAQVKSVASHIIIAERQILPPVFSAHAARTRLEPRSAPQSPRAPPAIAA